jgi:hypothetical protein
VDLDRTEGASKGTSLHVPSCAKKIEDGQDCSLVWKQGDVEIRAHAEGCAMRAVPRVHQALGKPALVAVTPKKKR